MACDRKPSQQHELILESALPSCRQARWLGCSAGWPKHVERASQPLRRRTQQDGRSSPNGGCEQPDRPGRTNRNGHPRVGSRQHRCQGDSWCGWPPSTPVGPSSWFATGPSRSSRKQQPAWCWWYACKRQLACSPSKRKQHWLDPGPAGDSTNQSSATST